MANLNIYALLIGINEYPVPAHRLGGCINDMDSVSEYLMNRFNDSAYHLNIKTLKNDEATRQNIIDGFDHFKTANENDICLLFFSGHGSQTGAPEEFWPVEKDKLLETIVCYDSRIGDGRDLCDKELGYLIWKATDGKKVHFTVIMDCCNSGTNTRDLSRAKIRTRMTEPNLQNVESIQRLLGYEQYDSNMSLYKYKSTHTQLAAARSDQAAKEMEIDGKQRGVFTYALLQTLYQSNSLISYAELLPRVALKLAYYANDQYPQLDINGEADRNALFLNGAIKPNSQSLLVSYSRDSKWRLNAGSLHGIIASSPGSPTVVLVNGNTRAQVTEVHAAESFLQGWDHSGKNETYPALIQEMARKRLKVAFAEDSEQQGMDNIKKEIEILADPYIELKGDLQLAEYVMHAVILEGKGFLYLTKKSDNRPVFQRIAQLNAAAASIFVHHISAVAKWHYVVQINNESSSITSADLQIRFLRIEGVKDFEQAAGQIADHSERILCSYKWINGEWVPPAFKLEIKNRGNKKLYLKALYLGNDFSIQEMALHEDTRDALGRTMQWSSLALQLLNNKAYGVGIPEINETIKLYVSTQPVQVDFFEQPGLEPDHKGPVMRELSQRSTDRGRSDWKAIHIDVCISKPLEWQSLLPGQPARFPGSDAQIETPAGTSCEVSFSSLQMNTRSSKPSFLLNPELAPFEVTSGWNLSQGLSVVEFRSFTGKELVGTDEPLKIKLPLQIKTGIEVMPYGYDKSAGAHVPIGNMQGLQCIDIIKLPDVEPGKEGTGYDIIKVYLLEKNLNADKIISP